ncbi:SDR family NAD(P)-dependent oxidoreductase [Propioniciclava soli]|uniref:SDR family NAD(P)-dependent oxidoreductase n=1 Tax=Propioniciclava soli TaxID=2775081 RepID=A0ABZ3CBK4_9ACTN
MTADQQTRTPAPSDTLKQAYRTIRSLQAQVAELRRPAAAEPIAVVGMGCRFPGAEGTDAYWQRLRDGVDAVSEIPRRRFDVAPYYDPERGAPGKTRTRWGGFLDDLDSFDHAFFGISRREAEAMDPQQRIALETAWLALEDAQLPADVLAGSRAGVYVGVSSSDFATEGSRNPADITAYSSSGTAHSVVAGRISYVLNLQGPALAIDTACSSSLVAIHQACQALRAGECDVALGGGVNVVMSPLPSIAFSAFGMMSGDGRARAFDELGDGCVRGEGAGIVVLKRLSDARRDGDAVLALVVGNAVNQDGRSAGFTAPSAASQAACIREALQRGGVRPGDVQFVECHGTGTPLGDPIEVEALASVYGDRAERCFLGSAKTTISHLEAAAGVAGFIKAVLALQHRVVPPNLHFDRLNPHISFEGTSFAVPTSPQPWPEVDGPRHAAVSAFGFSGTNAHVVLAEAPPVDAPVQDGAGDSDGAGVLVISARSRSALEGLAGRYRDILDDPETRFRPLARASATGRSHLSHRLAVLADDRASALDHLERHLEGWPTEQVFAGVAKERPVAFVYSGQGAEFAGMARDLHRDEPAFASALDECAGLLEPHLRRPLYEVLWPDDPADAPLVHSMTYAQPGLFAVEYALTRLLESWGIRPDLVLGHSIGELCAATVAGVFPLERALPFVALRGRLLDRVIGGGMGAIGAPLDEVLAVLEGFGSVSVAARNSPGSVTVSGAADGVAAVCALFAERGVRTKVLPVTTASHSALVAPLMGELVAAARSLEPRTPTLPLVSNVTGAPFSWLTPIAPEYWGEHLRRPVQFEAGIRTARDLGFSTFVEIGPAPRLSAAIVETFEDEELTVIPTLRKGQPDREAVLASAARLHVAGTPVNWAAVQGPRRADAPRLPAYPFDTTPCPVVVQRGERSFGPAGAPTAPQVVHTVAWEPLGGRLDPASAGPFLVAGTDADAIVAALGAGAEPVEPARLPAALAAAEDGTVLLWLLDAVEPEPSGEAILEETVAATGQAAALLRAVAAADGRVTTWFVTRGAVQPGTGDMPGLAGVAQAGVWGMARAMEQELATGWGGILDLDPDADPAPQLTRARDTGLFQAGETQLALRDQPLVPRLVADPVADGALPLRPDAAYLVTGAFGGLGAHTCDWLVGQGARHLILAARSPLPPRARWTEHHDVGTAARIAQVRRLEAAGASVHVATLDVADAASLAGWLSTYDSEQRPPVRGVVHAAGAGGMVPLAEVSLEVLDAHARAKVAGAFNVATAVPTEQLDFVVLYSSLASVLSAPFTSPYAAANAALDGLAAALRGRGVPAHAVNWGLWDDVGLAGERDTASRGRGVRPLQPDRALAALPAVLGAGLGQATVVDIAWDEWAPAYRSATGSRILDLLADGRERTGGRDVLPTPEEVLALPETEREALVCDRMLRAIAQTLGANAAMTADSSLFDLGMDSLMAVELRNRLERRLGVRVPVSTFLSGDSVAALAAEVVASLTAPSEQHEIIVADDVEGDDAIARILAQAAGTTVGVTA